MYPWQDYSGRLSPLKLSVLVALFLPGLWTAFAFCMGWLQPRPFTEAIHEVGLWMLRFLFVALAITPMRQIVQWPRLILVRRMVGVAAFAYGLAHISLFIADLKFDIGKAASEIALRIYLTIGFAALLGLAALAATSTDAMVRRLGARQAVAALDRGAQPRRSGADRTGRGRLFLARLGRRSRAGVVGQLVARRGMAAGRHRAGARPCRDGDRRREGA